MPFRVAHALIWAILSIFSMCCIAKADDCDPNQFLIKDTTSIQASDQMQLAFILTSTKEQFESAKGGLGLFGALNFDAAKEAAQRISQTTKFDYARSYSINLLEQNLSGNALQAYVACLTQNRERPGIVSWVANRGGDIYTIKVFWVGVGAEGTAKNDEPVKVIGGELIQAPTKWVRALAQEVVVRKPNPAATTFVSFHIGGESGGITLVPDPDRILTRSISSKDQIVVHSKNVSSRVCGPSTVGGCITPSSGALLLPGSYGLTDVSTNEPKTFSTKVTQNRPEQICVEVTQGTSCCECQRDATARITAIELYPVPASQAQTDNPPSSPAAQSKK